MYVTTRVRTKQYSAEPLSAVRRLIAKQHGIKAHALVWDVTDRTGTYEYDATTVLMTEISEKLMLHKKTTVSGMWRHAVWLRSINILQYPDTSISEVQNKMMT